MNPIWNPPDPGCGQSNPQQLFRQQTDLSFSEWRQRSCVILALARLASGTPITRIALDFGYDSPAAFWAMFRRALGQPPSVWMEPSK